MTLKGSQISELISVHKTRSSRERGQWDRYLRWYRSQYWGKTPDLATGGGDRQVALETNYPYAFIDTMVSSIVPPNPQVTVLPRDPERANYAIYREALINDVFHKNGLSRLLWRLSTYASVCGRGIMKAVWRFQNQRVEYRVIDPRFIWFDPSAEKWEDIRYLIEVTALTKAEFEARAKAPLDPKKKRGKKRYDPEVVKRAEFGSYPAWLKPALKDAREINSEVFDWVIVYEVYDFTSGTYGHYLEDTPEPLFKGDLPYRFVKNPYTMLTFNDNLQSLEGISDIQIIDRQQQMLNELDTLELRHAQASIPVTLFHAGMVDNPTAFANNLMEATSPGDAVAVHGRPGIGINDIITHTPTATLVPSFDKMRQRIIQSIEFALGLPQYSRGVVGVADVATEVALADQAIRTRNGRRLQSLEYVIERLAKATAGLYEEFLSPKSTLPVRLTGQQGALEVTRETLGARSPGDARNNTLTADPLDYDYEVIPFSPTENSKTIQLKNLSQVLELYMQSPDVDKRALIEEINSLLNINQNLLRDQEEVEAEQQAMAQAQMAEEGGGPAPSPGSDQPPGPDGVAGPGGVIPGAPTVSIPPLPVGGPGVG